MYNRRILISEDDKSRILNMHNNAFKKEFGLISEKFIKDAKGNVSQVADTQPLNQGEVEIQKDEYDKAMAAKTNVAPTTTAAPTAAKDALKTKDDIIAFQDWVVNTKKQNIGNNNPLNKGAGVDGVMNPGGKTETAWNSGLGAEYLKSKEMTTSGNDAITYTYYIKDASGTNITKVFTTVDELNKAIAAKQVTPATMVWRKDIGKKIAVKDLNSAAINDAIASIAPDAEVEVAAATKYKVSKTGSGNPEEKTVEEIKTDGGYKFFVNSDNKYQAITGSGSPLETELKKVGGPEAVAQSTGNEAVDKWLNDPQNGAAMLYKDMKAKGANMEQLFDFLEKSNQLPQGVDKKAFRNALGQKADTWLGRLQSGAQNIGSAFTQGYNTQQVPR
jgi:phosphotransferase system IIB component